MVRAERFQIGNLDAALTDARDVANDNSNSRGW